MKKNTITALTLIAAFSMAASTAEAQIVRSKDVDKNIAVVEQEVVNKDEEEFLDKGVKSENVEMPQPEQQNITIDYLAPLGGEILLLSCLGGAYLIGKKRKENK